MKFSSTILLALAISYTSVSATPTPAPANADSNKGNIDVGPYAPGNATPDHVHASKGSTEVDASPAPPGSGPTKEQINEIKLGNAARGLISLGKGTPGNPATNAATVGDSDSLLSVALGPGTPGNPSANQGEVTSQHGHGGDIAQYGPGTPGNPSTNSIGVLNGDITLKPATNGNPTPNHANAHERRQHDDTSDDSGDDADRGDDFSAVPADMRRANQRRSSDGKPKAQSNKPQSQYNKPKHSDAKSSPPPSDGSNASKDLAAALNSLSGRSWRRDTSKLAEGDVCLQIGAEYNPDCSSSPLTSGDMPSDDNDSSFSGLGNILAIKPESQTGDDHYLLGAELGHGDDAPVVEVLPVGSSGALSPNDDSAFGGLLGFAPALPGPSGMPTGSPDDSTFGGPLGFAPALLTGSSSGTPTSPVSSDTQPTGSMTATPTESSSTNTPTSTEASGTATAESQSPSPPPSSTSDETTASSSGAASSAAQPTGQATVQDATPTSNDSISSPATSTSMSPSAQPTAPATSDASTPAPIQGPSSSVSSSASGVSVSASLGTTTNVASAVPSALPTDTTMASSTPATGLIGSLPLGTVACPSSLGSIHDTTNAALGQLVTLCIDASVLNVTPVGTTPCSDPDNLIAGHASDDQNPSLLSRILGSRSRFTGVTARARSVRRNGDLIALCVEAGAL